jgi:hypothetical protein
MPTDFFINIVNPNDLGGAKIRAIIPYQLILNYYKYYPVRYENFRAVKYVLENPKRIFAGIREFNEGGWCFTGKPQTWHIRADVQAPFPSNLVFAVYLNSGYVIYESRAEIAADDDMLCPISWQNRYGALIWKSTS